MARSYTNAALAYLRTVRGERPFASWFDVATAYEAGMKHALEARQSAKRALQQVADCPSDQVSEKP